MQLTELTEKHRPKQEEWTSAKTALEQRCSNVEAISEQRRLELLVVQAKLMQAEGATKAQIIDLRHALADAQFLMTMGEDKIRAILRRRKLNTLKMVSESMEKGWKSGRHKRHNCNYYEPTGKIGKHKDKVSSK